MVAHEFHAAWEIHESAPAVERTHGAYRVPRILVAQDDFEMRRSLVARLRTDGYEVVEAADGRQLAVQLDLPRTPEGSTDLDLIISDMGMFNVSGLERLAGLRAHPGAPRVILTTTFGQAVSHAEAERVGAVAVYYKPFDVDAMRTFVRGALHAGDRHRQMSATC
jgi:two-component system, response regulator, stage 0 sporulation protein F